MKWTRHYPSLLLLHVLTAVLLKSKLICQGGLKMPAGGNRIQGHLKG